MPRLILIVFSLFLLSACRRNADHLPATEMQKILMDVNLAEAYSITVKDSVHKTGTKNADSLSAFYQTIFSHYKITAEEFSKSLDWYKAHPDELDTMYNKMIPVATRWESAMPAMAPKLPPPPPPPPPPALPAPAPSLPRAAAVKK